MIRKDKYLLRKNKWEIWFIIFIKVEKKSKGNCARILVNKILSSNFSAKDAVPS